VPETRFCCLKWVGFWATICQISGVLQYPAPMHIYERQIPDPCELSIGQIPGVSRGGGMVTPGIDSCIILNINSILNALQYSEYARLNINRK
jgi:hypothetical protein